MEENKIPSKSEWTELNIQQLYDVKTAMTNRYFSMREINASFSKSYLTFIRELETLIAYREHEAAVAREPD